MAQKELTFFNDVPAFASFPYVVEPRASKEKNPDGTPKYVTYEIVSCFDVTHPKFIARYEEMKAVALRVLKEKFGPDAQFGVAGLKSPFRQASEFDLKLYPNYEGKIICAMKSYNRPVDVKDIYNKPITDKRDIYPGCIIVPSFGFYAYNNVSKGVAGALRCVVKLANSTPWVVIASAERDYAGIDFSQYSEVAEEMYANSSGVNDELG